MQKTLENLAKAFIGESQARNRYSYYARVAQKDGYEQIAEIFMITSEQEKTHAKREFEHIQSLKEKLGGVIDQLNVEGAVPTVYADTISNLKAAIAGETYEYTEMYPEFAKVADEEGLTDIANRFRAIAKAEENHAERYKLLLAQLENGAYFKRGEKIWWVCRECGYVHFGNQPPEKCPSCDHPQAFYAPKLLTY